MDRQQANNEATIVDEFVVKVKLLSNQVFEFVIDPENTKVSDLKKMILDKIKVPLERQRIIFGAKQLLDDHKVTDYVKESGMTVHLIAKMQTQENSTQNNTNNNASNTSNTQPQSTSTNNTNQPQQQHTNQQQNTNNNPLGNFLRGFGLGGPIGGPFGPPQATTMTFTGNMGDLNSSLGGLLGSLGIGLPPQRPPTSQTQTQPNPPRQPSTQNVHNNPFQTPPTNSQRIGQQRQNTTSSFNLNQPQQQQNLPQNQSQFHVSNQPILHLNQTISTLDLPSEPVLDNRHLSLRQQTAQYLRRLQHQYMRMIPQMNRTVHLLNEGRVSHLGEVLRLLEAIDSANRHAQEAIRRLINLPVNQAQQSNQPEQVTSLNLPRNNIELQSVQIQLENDGDNPLNLGDALNNVQATIIIQENQIDDTIDEEPTVLHNQQTTGQSQQSQTTQNAQHSTHQQPPILNLNGMGGLSNMLQGLTGQPLNQGTQPTSQQTNMIGGLNLGGIMSMLGGMGMNMGTQQGNISRPPQQTATTQTNTQQSNQQQGPHVHGPGCNHSHHQPSNPQQQLRPQQFPQIDLSNLASMASMFLNPQQQSTQQQSSSQQPTSTQSRPQQQQNPMGGLMGIFSSLQQSGGMGELLNTSLGDTLEEGLREPTIYSTILKSFTGSDLLTCFTSKNFQFLDRKYDSVRQNFLHAISIAGSQQELVEKTSRDIANLIVPKNNVNDYEQCFEQVKAILRRQVSQVVRVTLNRGDSRYSQKLTACLKLAFCEAIEKVVASVNPQTLANGQSATQLVFQNLKTNSIQLMDEFIQGLSGMFYGFIQRDLIRIYNEYREEQKRKQQRSLEQVASEEELLKQIQTESKKDIEYLKSFKHSQFYHPKSQ